MYEKIFNITHAIKENRPLIINITNDVTMDFIANGLLSLGASPIMTKAPQEIDELVQIASGVVINIGTLTHDFVDLCHQVCAAANRLKKPITLDPVGAGASHYRTQTCLDLLNHFKISIMRGNASEIMALAGASHHSKGVDALGETHDAVDSAQFLSHQHQAVVVVSGKMDAVVDPNQVSFFERGSLLMPQITGSGCLLTAVVSAFDAVHHDAYEAASAAVQFYGVCGEIAARKTQSPGSFKPYFIDALNALPQRQDYERTCETGEVESHHVI